MVFPLEQKHVPAAGAEERADWGSEQTQKCLEFALEKYTAAVSRIAQCSACVVRSVCERDRMWGTTKGIRWGESPEKQFENNIYSEVNNKSAVEKPFLSCGAKALLTWVVSQ